jgi:hypothetical protein
MCTSKSYLRFLLAISLVLSAMNHAFADAPATEFFVMDSAKLSALASDDAKLDTLTADQLSKSSIMHGSYTGGLSLMTMTAKFRVDARFSAAFSEAKDSISYNICASTNPDSWDVCSEQGTAVKTGKQFVTENWRTRAVVVVFRFLNLRR